LIFDALRRFFADSAGLADHLGGLNIQQMQLLSARSGEREALMKEGSAKQKSELARRLISDVVVISWQYPT